LLSGHADDGEEAGHVVAAAAREVAALGEAPERRFGIAGERAVDPALARVVGGQREGPVAVAVVEEAEILRGGARGPPGLHTGVGACWSGAHAARTARSMSGARMAGRREQAACRPRRDAEIAPGAQRALAPSGHRVTPPAKFGRLALLKRMF